ncbi:uncharacterized protein PAC_08434 [Phialocephala subalpina]|uniref:Amidoligase enzyme n=1 Tax=Phialocephala subalpina TaxID=576137 RepID=A0A1L7X0J6_9HELO|nr:uncharacterized protein PAC_08434 [Phialocephala subalpina]
MAPIIYFGVELEFCLGYSIESTNTDPSSKSFPDFLPFNGKVEERGDRKRTYCIGRKFRATGLPFASETKELGDLDTWAIGCDTSIGMHGGKQSSPLFPMEITSPACPFESEPFEDVRKVCNILSTEYAVTVNEDCALHIHFSFGRDLNDKRKRWNLERLKRLMMLFWMFEPLFDTLHPPHIQKDPQDFVISIRRHSLPAKGFPNEKGGIPDLDFCQIRRGLEQINRRLEWAEADYFTGADGEEIDKKSKPTVEFRQHEGTVDSESVINWIKTPGGIMPMVDRASTLKQEDLENAEKTKRSDATRKEKGGGGPGFPRGHPRGEDAAPTIINILESIELEEQANYYRDKLYELVPARFEAIGRLSRKALVHWSER